MQIYNDFCTTNVLCVLFNKVRIVKITVLLATYVISIITSFKSQLWSIIPIIPVTFKKVI